MSLNRYAKRRDANEPEIIQALEAIGVTVYRQDLPLDLLCCYRGVTFNLEVKDGNKVESRTKATKGQDQFLATWTGPARIVKTVSQAIAAAQEFANGR